MENICFAKIILYNLRTIFFLDYRIRAEMIIEIVGMLETRRLEKHY